MRGDLIFTLTSFLILTSLQKSEVEFMLCDTDFNSLLVEDHLIPMPISRIRERLSRPVRERS
jgi:hypothetical protein